MTQDYVSRFISAQDGLRLHVRDYGPRLSDLLPVICLPGLARTAADFVPLARVLAQQGRRVLALDYRGRGRSDHDRDPANYSLPTELSDLIAVLTALDIAHAVFIGTSRGGLLTMLLATIRPAAIAGAVLNDIGPVIETKGLMRIKSYVGKLPEPRSFEDGAEILRRLFDAQFPNLTADDWRAAARNTWDEQEGRLILMYDARLSEALKSVDPEQPIPPLWQAFDALSDVPLLVIRGAHSDILSPETVAAMRARRPDMGTIEVPDQGHAPLLAESDTIDRIVTFVAACETHRLQAAR